MTEMPKFIALVATLFQHLAYILRKLFGFSLFEVMAGIILFVSFGVGVPVDGIGIEIEGVIVDAGAITEHSF